MPKKKEKKRAKLSAQFRAFSESGSVQKQYMFRIRFSAFPVCLSKDVVSRDCKQTTSVHILSKVLQLLKSSFL